MPMNDNLRMSGELRLSVLIFMENEKWVAQVLEHDMAAHGDTPYAALAAVELVIKTHAIFDVRQQREAFSRLKPAPDVYWRAFRRGQPMPPPTRMTTTHESLIEPMLPAHITAAMALELDA